MEKETRVRIDDDSHISQHSAFNTVCTIWGPTTLSSQWKGFFFFLFFSSGLPLGRDVLTYTLWRKTRATQTNWTQRDTGTGRNTMEIGSDTQGAHEEEVTKPRGKLANLFKIKQQKMRSPTFDVPLFKALNPKWVTWMGEREDKVKHCVLLWSC